MARRAQLRRLERDAFGERTDLVCPECGWEVTVYGDVLVDMIVLDWRAGTGRPLKYASEHAPFAAHKSMGELFNHEHPYEDFVEKRHV